MHDSKWKELIQIHFRLDIKLIKSGKKESKRLQVVMSGYKSMK